MSNKDYRLTITVHSSNKEYPPITFGVLIPEELALKIMATPLGSVTFATEVRPHILTDKSKLIDYKP